MSRKLVTVRKILKLEKHSNADTLEIANIGGWQIIVKEKIHKLNDLVLFFEIDSFLPPIEVFEFVRSGSTFKKMEVEGEIKEGFRLRTMKLRGTLSQGIILPLSYFPETDFSDTKKCYASELGVIKWEPPISPQLQGVVKGNFPSFIPKTTQERIQNCSKLLEQNEGVTLIKTEKMHGQSMTVYRYEDEIGVCSRNLDLKETDSNVLWQTAKKLNLNNLGISGIAIQGELCGPGINKNMYGFEDFKFLVFDIWNIVDQKYLNREVMDIFCEILKLEQVPNLGKVTLNGSVEDYLSQADGKSVISKNIREGLVFVEENRKFSFKVISNKWLLKKGE